MNTVAVPTTLSGTPDLHVSAESELMQNHQPALPVSPEQAIYAVHDAQGHPIVIGFSPDGDFYALHHADDAPTGWTQVDLSPSLHAYGDARAVVASQLSNGYIFLAAAVRRLDDATTDDLFVAGPLDPDLSKTDWSKLDDLWTRSPTPEPGTTIERIFVGPDADGQGYGTPLLAVSLAGSHGLGEYLVQADVDASAGTLTWDWHAFPTPTAKAQLIDYALGTVSDLGSGVYILYQGDGDVPWLVFKTLPNAYGRDFDRQFTAPAGAAALQAVATGGAPTTGLLVGGSDGLHWFAPDNQQKLAAPVQVASADQVPGIRPGGLVARADQLADGTLAVWALSGEDLYHLSYQADTGWTTPLLFQQGVARIAPLRNQRRYANELVYVDADVENERALYYMWQDPTTTLWRRDHIPLHDTGHVLEFSCYTSVVTLATGDGAPLVGQPLRLSADSWQRVIVNGVTHVVDPSTTVAVEPDARGTLTLITKVNDLAAPVLHLTADFFAGTLDVDPAHKVHATLSAVQSASDIPVLPSRLPDGFSGDDVANTVQQLMQFHPKTGGPPAEAITYRTGERSRSLSLARLPVGHTFGVSFGGGIRYHDAAAVATLGLRADAGTPIKDVAGDVFEYLKHVIDDVEHLVVTVLKDAVEFVITIGDEIRRFVADNFPALYRALTWLFEKLKVAFEALIRWLGHLFGWDDIWRTHKVLAALLTNVIDYGVRQADAEIDQWKSAVSQMLDTAKEQVKEALDTLVLPADVRDLQPRQQARKAQEPGARLEAPAAGWSTYHLQHSGILPPAPTGSGGTPGGDPLSQFFTDVVEPTITALWTHLEDDIEDLQRLLNGSPTVADVVAFISDLVDTIFDPLKTLIVGLHAEAS